MPDNFVPDTVIAHQNKVRQVILAELNAPEAASPLQMLHFSSDPLSGSYNKTELENYFDGYNQALNALMDRLEELGILSVYQP